MKDKLDGKIKAILFDLDGTLLDVDLDKFIPQYLNLLAQSVAHIITPKKFISKIMMASKAVEENNGKHTNNDVYTEIHVKKFNLLSINSMSKIFQRFANILKKNLKQGL